MSLKLARFREIAFPVIAVWVVLLLAVTPLFSAVQAKPAEQTALLVSDDFSGCALNTSLWTAIDPVGDGTISLDGENLVFTIPTGSIHTLTGTGMTDYQYTVTRIMQPSNNTSSEAEAKFVTGVSHKYEMQGIVVQDNDSNLLRIEFFSEGRNTVLYVAKIVNGARSDLRRVNIGAPGLAPL
jgi:hypothetical protein